MNKSNFYTKKLFLKIQMSFCKPVQSLVFLVVFFVNIIGIVPFVQAQEFSLPQPGTMVALSPAFNPPILKGIKLHADNPFRFDFILNKGDGELSKDQLKEQSSKLVKYFLASLTIPSKDLWVNLSPYEKDRIIPASFGLTQMGRDLLAEDYILKQITASLIYPEKGLGKEFWKRIYEEASKKYGTTDVPVNTFNKVWIVPAKAVVYENVQTATAYVTQASLKVMLEEDYVSTAKHERVYHKAAIRTQGESILTKNILREIIIPELTKEVNEDRNFAQLRQVYYSVILATWYKKKVTDSILAQVYENKNKVAGVGYGASIIDKSLVHNDVEGIYNRYLQAFKKGVYNYIKDDRDALTQEIIPRKYFSGGSSFSDPALLSVLSFNNDAASIAGNDSNELDMAVELDDAFSGNWAMTTDKFNEYLKMISEIKKMFLLQGSDGWNYKLETGEARQGGHRFFRIIGSRKGKKEVVGFIQLVLRNGHPFVVALSDMEIFSIRHRDQELNIYAHFLTLLRQFMPYGGVLESAWVDEKTLLDIVDKIIRQNKNLDVLMVHELGSEMPEGIITTSQAIEIQSRLADISLRAVIAKEKGKELDESLQKDRLNFHRQIWKFIYQYQKITYLHRRFLSIEYIMPDTIQGQLFKKAGFRECNIKIMSSLVLSKKVYTGEVIGEKSTNFGSPLDRGLTFPTVPEINRLWEIALEQRKNNRKVEVVGFPVGVKFKEVVVSPTNRFKLIGPLIRRGRAMTFQRLKEDSTPDSPKFAGESLTIEPSRDRNRTGEFSVNFYVEGTNTMRIVSHKRIASLPEWNMEIMIKEGEIYFKEHKDGDPLHLAQEVQGPLSEAESKVDKKHKDEAKAMISENGGIDLTAGGMNLQTQYRNGDFEYHMDAAMLNRLQNVRGFVPVIISIQPMKNLKLWLLT